MSAQAPTTAPTTAKESRGLSEDAPSSMDSASGGAGGALDMRLANAGGLAQGGTDSLGTGASLRRQFFGSQKDSSGRISGGACYRYFGWLNTSALMMVGVKPDFGWRLSEGDETVARVPEIDTQGPNMGDIGVSRVI